MALHSLSFIHSDFSVKFHIVKISFIESFFWQMSLLLEKNGKRRSLVQELKLKLKSVFLSRLLVWKSDDT